MKRSPYPCLVFIFILSTGFSLDLLGQSDPEIITEVDLELLTSLVEGNGDTVVASELTTESTPYVRASSPDGLTYFLYGTVCDETGSCKGFEIASYFSPSSSPFSLELTNKLNADLSAVSVSLGEDGYLYLTRYVILDFGQTWKNLKLNIQVLQSIALNVGDRIQGDE